jgi:hypothetical protein
VARQTIKVFHNFRVGDIVRLKTVWHSRWGDEHEAGEASRYHRCITKITNDEDFCIYLDDGDYAGTLPEALELVSNGLDEVFIWLDR